MGSVLENHLPLYSAADSGKLYYTTVDSYTQPDVELFSYLHSLAFAENRYGLATAMHMIYFLVIATILILIFCIYWAVQHRKGRQRHAF